ncbi:hypothetical protein QUB80_33405 [Chlorogloeopsis sp. ULAP01]|uniref:hypothetical protein n=1 Tax=Chlorogloeopsis sp. ULAP01 TaxID=3056483 RepID=UPI0025AAE8B7|nr:hypothetical protein [Chlorogloeopsis sp. ULAP01]MDM9385555.1 hypothetical protein [Chlorogloeopsis sp. ULAP01]
MQLKLQKQIIKEVKAAHVINPIESAELVGLHIDVSDRRRAKIVKSCQDIPGQELFQYLDDDRYRKANSSGDVNDYLRKITGLDFTAKVFVPVSILF